MVCATCRDSRTVRRPKKSPLSVFDYNYDTTPCPMEVETIPCPECHGGVDEGVRNRVRVLSVEHSIDSRLPREQPEALEWAMASGANALATKLIESGAVKVTAKEDTNELRLNVRSDVCVVMPTLGRHTFADQIAAAEAAAERRGMEKAARIARASASKLAGMDHFGPVQALAVRGVADEIGRAVDQLRLGDEAIGKMEA